MKREQIEKKRFLNDIEIERICAEVLTRNENIPHDVGEAVYQKNKKKTIQQLKKVLVYPKTIPYIIKEMKTQYQKTIIQAGESVGVITAQSIGERQTQLSVHADERIVVYDKDTKHVFSGRISDFIDNLLNEENGKYSVCILDGEENKIRCMDKKNIYIQTVNGQEHVSWQKISEVSRHPANGPLICVKTMSGRQVRATLSHSFLKRSNDPTNRIIPIEGRNLRVGDLIPVVKKSPMFQWGEEKGGEKGEEKGEEKENNSSLCFLLGLCFSSSITRIYYEEKSILLNNVTNNNRKNLFERLSKPALYPLLQSFTYDGKTLKLYSTIVTLDFF